MTDQQFKTIVPQTTDHIDRLVKSRPGIRAAVTLSHRDNVTAFSLIGPEVPCTTSIVARHLLRVTMRALTVQPVSAANQNRSLQTEITISPNRDVATLINVFVVVADG
jgi:hypothetical protein